MEYEISDEDRLFDESTNPSLQREDPATIRHPSSVKPAGKRRLQRAVLIPEEEEHQLA